MVCQGIQAFHRRIRVGESSGPDEKRDRDQHRADENDEQVTGYEIRIDHQAQPAQHRDEALLPLSVDEEGQPDRTEQHAPEQDCRIHGRVPVGLRLVRGSDSGRAGIVPRLLLQDRTIAVVILERSAARFPERVEGCHVLESGSRHTGAQALPLPRIGNVEHHQILRGGGWRHRVGTAVRELEVVAGSLKAEHDSVEPLVILEAADDPQAEPAAVHVHATPEITDRPGDTQMGRHGDGRTG
jgi:hypothetical protein